MPEAAPGRPSGLLVAVEGSDGSGKSTAIHSLGRWLTEQRVPHRVLSMYGNRVLLRQFAELNRQALITAREATMMIVAEVAGRTESVVRPLLDAGHVVIWDKYKVGGRVRDRCRNIPESVLDALYGPLPDPDLTIYLTIAPSVATARKRAAGGPTLWESGLDVFLDAPIAEIEHRLSSGALGGDRLDRYFEAFQARLQEGYGALLAGAPHVRIDAERPVTEVALGVRGAVARHLGIPADAAASRPTPASPA